MKTFPDKGITQPIVYNFLNLPQYIAQNSNETNYIYRADGTKVSKAFILNGTTIDTDYLDGFVYTSTYSQQIEAALLEDDLSTREATTAGQEEALQLEQKVVVNDPPSVSAAKPSFFPTAEGFYDYDNLKYIYQYKDHLGNVRLSYSKNATTGLIAIEDTNDYYPFGLSFINTSLSKYSPSTTYKNWKFQEQELQETGFYQFKWRQYMPDVARFFNVDPLAEKYTHNSTYAFSENRVIDAVELEGLEAVVINDTTIEWKVKVDNKLGFEPSKTLLQDAADVLSQNGVTVKIVEDPNAIFTVELSAAKTVMDPVTKEPITTNGHTINDGNIYDGSVVSKDNPRTLAHELGHKAGLPHIFDKESKVPNTKENRKNLMNSGDNIDLPVLTEGTDLKPSQTKDMVDHIRIKNENRARDKQTAKEQINNIHTGNGN